MAISVGRRNTRIKSLSRSFKLQRLSWSFVELTRHRMQLPMRVYRHVGSLGELLSEQTIGFLVGTTLPATLRIAEVNINVVRQGKAFMIRKLLAPVQGQGFIQLPRRY